MEIKKIAAIEGIIGIAFFDRAVGGTSNLPNISPPFVMLRDLVGQSNM